METESSNHLATHSLILKILIRARSALRAFRRNIEPSNRLLSIQERLRIGPKQTAVVVNCCGRQYLLAFTDDSIQFLGYVEPSPPELPEGSGGRQ